MAKVDFPSSEPAVRCLLTATLTDSTTDLGRVSLLTATLTDSTTDLGRVSLLTATLTGSTTDLGRVNHVNPYILVPYLHVPNW